MRKQVLPLRMGLSALLHDPNVPNTCIDDALAKSVVLNNNHPFELPMYENMRDLSIANGRQCETIHLIAEPIVFENGMRALTTLVRGLAGASELGNNPFRFLRKIKTPGDNDILAFYEVGTYHGSFLAGARVSHGFGRWEYESQRMDAMFSLISMVFGIPFDECFAVVDDQAVIHELRVAWDLPNRRAA